MSYATPDQLAEALRIKATPDNTETLQACLDAADAEIDHHIDQINVVIPLAPVPAIVVRTSVNRGVEWFKASDSANGGVGFDQTGVLTPPASGFGRHAAALIPVTQQWGVG